MTRHSAATAMMIARKTVCDRAKTHGSPIPNYRNVATLWNAFLQVSGRGAVQITAADAAMMMLLLKVARMHTGEFNPDDLIDLIGYAAVHAEVKAAEQ